MVVVVGVVVVVDLVVVVVAVVVVEMEVEVVVMVLVVVVMEEVVVHAICISVLIGRVARLFWQSQPPRAGQASAAVRRRAIPVPHPALTVVHSAGYV